jgi:hypothetical protein
MMMHDTAGEGEITNPSSPMKWPPKKMPVTAQKNVKKLASPFEPAENQLVFWHPVHNRYLCMQRLSQ